MATVLIDTKEKQPWTFTNFDMEFVGLHTGDYTLKGFEDLVCIERKHCAAEIANNITEKRFEPEMERMSHFRYKFMVFEFGLSHIYTFPMGAKLSQKIKNRIRIRGPFIVKTLIEFQLKYGVQIVPCGHREFAQSYVSSLFKRIIEQHG